MWIECSRCSLRARLSTFPFVRLRLDKTARSQEDSPARHTRRARDTIALMRLDYGKCPPQAFLRRSAAALVSRRFGFGCCSRVWLRFSQIVRHLCCQQQIEGSIRARLSHRLAGFRFSCLPAILIFSINGPADACWSMRLFRRTAVPLRAALLARLLTC